MKPRSVEPIFVNWYPEGAEIICVGRTTMAELIASGKIKSAKLGRKRLVEVAELRRFAEELTAGAA